MNSFNLEQRMPRGSLHPGLDEGSREGQLPLILDLHATWTVAAETIHFPSLRPWLSNIGPTSSVIHFYASPGGLGCLPGVKQLSVQALAITGHQPASLPIFQSQMEDNDRFNRYSLERYLLAYVFVI